MFFRSVSRQPACEEFWKTGIYNNLKERGFVLCYLLFSVDICKVGFVVGKLGLRVLILREGK